MNLLHYSDLEKDTWYWAKRYSQGSSVFTPAFLRIDGKIALDRKVYEAKDLAHLDFYRAIMPNDGE